MEYSMGVVGIGHWFKRLEAGLQTVGGIKVTKALGTKPYEQKVEMLRSLGITPDSYYVIGSDGTIPAPFFDGIEVVHISNPNEVHASQTMQSLSKGKKVVVEKSYAVNKREFDTFRKFVKEGGYDKSMYLHLHYLHKLPALMLKRSMKELIAKHGKITGIEATFFEKTDEEDTRRAGWLLEMKSGGLFMDWVHPFEVAYAASGTGFGKISDLKIYMTNSAYSEKDPSGVYAEVGLKGSKIAGGATIRVNIAKGVDPKYAKKSMVFKFEDGAYARLVFIGSGEESKENRGSFELGKVVGGRLVSESSEVTFGRASSEYFVKEIIKLCNGKRAGLSIGQISKVFRPQWDYQKTVQKQQLIKDPSQVILFLENGIKVT